MKKIIALLLACVMTLSGCGLENKETNHIDTKLITLEDYNAKIPEFNDLSDEALLRFIEDNIYNELIDELNSDEYYIENISAAYVSREYMEEAAFNSQSNVFFGYTLNELDDQFQGTRYVFTLGDNGTTGVQALEGYDDTYERLVKNVSIGNGVILLCVTASAVSAGVGAPAISMIFAASAKSGASFAISSAALGGIAGGIITGINTGDFNEAIKSGALAGSENFKWGAISGTIFGGATQATALKGAKLNGLTMNEAALIQKESKYPLEIIKQFKSMEEYKVYKKAGLEKKMVAGKSALVQEIDLDYKSELVGKLVTNLERMKDGYAPIEPLTGKAYQLHHINQSSDGTLAVLTEAQHQGNSLILNTIGKSSEIPRNAFAKTRKEFWISFAEGFEGAT